MKQVFLLFQTILLLCTLSNTQPQHVGDKCQSNSDCDAWLSCLNNVCTACAKPGNICIPGTTIGFFKCCDGSNTTCELIPGLNGTNRCMRNQNNCNNDSDCAYGLFCLKRLGKCGLCHPNGERCTISNSKFECCSGYCKTDIYNDDSESGICDDPRTTPTPTTPTTSTTTESTVIRNRNIDIHDINGDVDITPDTISSFIPYIYNNDLTSTTATSEEVPTKTSTKTSTTTPTTTTEEIPPRYCVDGNQCGINMCINNLCTKCQNINTLCQTNSDCCQSKYNKIVCAVANYLQHIVGYHIHNKKICIIE